MHPSHAASRSPFVPLLIAATVIGLLGGGAVLFMQQRGERAEEQANSALADSRVHDEALRAPSSDQVPRDKPPRLPAPAGEPLPSEQKAAPGAMPQVKELANGDREITLLDGLVVIQPRAEQDKFALFRAGERNSLGLPSGVLKDGSFIYENMPITIRQGGRAIEVLQRSRVSKIEGPIVDTEGAGQTPH